MIAGLPLATWVLFVLSVAPGLILIVAAYRIHGPADFPRDEKRKTRGDFAPGGRGPSSNPGTLLGTRGSAKGTNAGGISRSEGPEG